MIGSFGTYGALGSNEEDQRNYNVATATIATMLANASAADQVQSEVTWAEGVLAYLEGVALRANPYPDKSSTSAYNGKYRGWKQGWQSEKDRARTPLGPAIPGPSQYQAQEVRIAPAMAPPTAGVYPFAEGRAAYAAGAAVTDNPYARVSQYSAEAWAAGWQDAASESPAASPWVVGIGAGVLLLLVGGAFVAWRAS